MKNPLLRLVRSFRAIGSHFVTPYASLVSGVVRRGRASFRTIQSQDAREAFHNCSVGRSIPQHILTAKSPPVGIFD